MEGDVRNSIEYWVSIDTKLEKSLFKLRDWSHLKIAREDSLTWIRGFIQSEIESPLLLSLPNLNRYYLAGAKLILYGRRLPSRVEPNLLWTPIQRGLKVTLPSQNFNYFGLDQSYQISLIPSNHEMPSTVTIIDLTSLKNYVSSAPNIRLKNLNWTLLNEHKAIVWGSPILPLTSEDFYKKGCFIIPAGWKFKYDNMAAYYEETLSKNKEYWYLISTEHKIYSVKISDFTPLNKGSFINTMASFDSLTQLLQI